NCGGSRIPEVKEPWKCNVCGSTNDVDDERCGTCDAMRGAENPVARETLERIGEALPTLSFDARSFAIVDGVRSEPLDVRAFRVGTLRPVWNGDPVPTMAFKSAGLIKVCLDLSHPAFIQLGVRPEEAVAFE